MPEIPIQLQPKPEISRHTRYARETQRRIRGDRPLATHNFIQARKRNAKPDSKGGLRDLERFQELLEQHLARVRRGNQAWQETFNALP